MDLELKTIIDIKKIIKKYELENPNTEFLYKVIEVLNEDLAFSGVLNLEQTNRNVVLYTETQKENLGNIKINYKNMLKDLNRHINVFLEDVDYKKLVVYFSLFYILHECSHVLQCLWAYNDKNKYPQINETYKIILNKMNNSKYINFIYYLNRYKFFTERNANILALETLNEVYKNDFQIKTINSEYYLYNLFDLYNMKKQKSPIEITYKLIKYEDFIDTDDLPFSELIKHGFKLSDKQWNLLKELYEIYKRPCEASVLENEISKKIRQL